MQTETVAGQNGNVQASWSGVTTPPVMYVHPLQTNTATKNERYLAKQSIGLGAAQIVLGSICIVFNAVSLGLGPFVDVGFVGHGIWCGVLFIITGAFGIAAGTAKTKCKIIAYMVLCIISACFTTALLSVGIIGATCNYYYNSYSSNCYGYGFDYNYDYYYRSPCSYYQFYTTMVAMEGCMAASAFIAAILFIWGSALCCKAKPCCCSEANTAVAHTVGYIPNGGLVIQGAATCQLTSMPYQPGFVAPPPYQGNCTVPQWTYPPSMPVTAAAGGASNTGYTSDDPSKY